jgi:hypothetical protein
MIALQTASFGIAAYVEISVCISSRKLVAALIPEASITVTAGAEVNFGCVLALATSGSVAQKPGSNMRSITMTYALAKFTLSFESGGQIWCLLNSASGHGYLSHRDANTSHSPPHHKHSAFWKSASMRGCVTTDISPEDFHERVLSILSCAMRLQAQ